MLRWLAYLVIIASTIAIAWTRGDWYRVGSEEPAAVEADAADTPPPAAHHRDVGKPLYARSEVVAPVVTPLPAVDPVVLRDCRVNVIDKQEVPCPRDGILLFVGTEIQPGEQVPPGDRVSVKIGFELKSFRRLKVGDEVKAGQLVAFIDDRITRDEWAIKKARLAAARAELEAAIKVNEEFKNRFDTQLRLSKSGVTAEEEVRRSKLSWDNAALEVVGKRQAVALAEHELNQIDTVLRMHEVRASLPGVIKSIYKSDNEAVRSFEPVVRIHNLERVRVEGLVDVQNLPRLRIGMPAVIEPAPQYGPRTSLLGHLQEVTGVAVSKTGEVISSSKDGTIIAWDAQARRQRRQWKQDAAALCVDCTEPSSTANLCLVGASDGTARLWKLDADESRPVLELRSHEGNVTAVAFSPDGLTCATGGEDRSICLWETQSGRLRYQLTAAHRGAVTSLAFTPAAQLVSAGQDQAMRVWSLGVNGATLENTLEHRSGHLTCPGISPEGKLAIFDDGDKLRLLTLPEGNTAGVLNSGNGQSFTGFARFSRTGSLLVTQLAGTESPLHVWRAPFEGRSATVLGKCMLPAGAVVTSGVAFAADDRFVAAGTHDGRVLLWDLPSARNVNERLQARVTLLDTGVESSAAQVRVWAELPNTIHRLLPGTTVNMVLFPE
ncbi:MAG: WD40 repeat domain-containing protein [Gemmataceae bacterium]